MTTTPAPAGAPPHQLADLQVSTADECGNVAAHLGAQAWQLAQAPDSCTHHADWVDKQVALVEIDLVQHDSDNLRWVFACTLTVTDVGTGWIEDAAVRNKAQRHVFSAHKHERAHLPVPLRGVDSDSVAEFINYQFIRYCLCERLTFTRGRVGHKNNNAFVKQKN